jgi:hypothetical protein
VTPSSYRIIDGSLQQQFFASRAKVQMYGGGFANGKTSAMCIRALMLAQVYPGAEFLLARATYPKLEDTLKKEFLKWCPKDWIKKKTDKPNNVHLTNGTTINFRYIAQQGKNEESTTSNLLSANYDLAMVDQIEDPEIVHKDILDLLGRLRGTARYTGNDPTMPSSGPRWLILSCNPTRNWVYKKLVRPLHDYQHGIKNANLLCDVEGKPIIDIFEGSTYGNKDNLPPDYIETLEASYTGQMRDRYLMGKWGAYEGLVFPMFDEQVHMVDQHLMEKTVQRKRDEHVRLTVIEGYDYGIAAPSCYLLGLADEQRNVLVVDGFYHPEMEIGDQAAEIRKIREKHLINDDNSILADPDLFRRKPGQKGHLSTTVAGLFRDEDIRMHRADNAILPGITKARQYLTQQKFHINPFYGTPNAPFIYFSNHLEFVPEEFASYTWKKDTSGEVTDAPIDKKNHALDGIRYLLSRRPELGKVVLPFRKKHLGLTSWAESDYDDHEGKARYGR